jgi:NADH-quinone oxidoreductase subunit H
MGISTIGVLLLAGSLSMVDIVTAQQKMWFVFVQPIGFVLFMLTALAETNRTPFDLAEAEAELVAGFHTEYSSMRFGLFFLGEYTSIITICSIAVTLFLGGWNGPINLGPLNILWFVIKLFVLLFVFIWTRWTLPRFRYDQLMNLGWKVLLPVSLLNVMMTGVMIYLRSPR